jgi:hypothetical protein
MYLGVRDEKLEIFICECGVRHRQLVTNILRISFAGKIIS